MSRGEAAVAGYVPFKNTFASTMWYVSRDTERLDCCSGGKKTPVLTHADMPSIYFPLLLQSVQ
jgi:hypothetical protein